MFKPIPTADVIVRPFKAYKDWQFDQNTLPVHLIQSLTGSYDQYENIYISGSGYQLNEYALDKSIRTLYYNGTPKLVGVVTNWDVTKYKKNQIYKYIVAPSDSTTLKEYNYYYDTSKGSYVNEFQDYLNANGLFVTDLGQILRNQFADITKLYGSMKNLGSVQERYIGNRYFLWIVPQRYVGEEIKPGSFRLIDYGRTKSTFNGTTEYVTITDDGYGNLIEDQNDFVGLRAADMGQFSGSYTSSYQVAPQRSAFQSTEGIISPIDINSFDFGDESTKETEELNYNYNKSISQSIEDIDRTDFQNSYLVSSGSNDLPYPIQNPKKVVGNIFYANGIITLTHQTELDEDCNCGGQENYNFGWNGYHMEFQSTKTIYENEAFIQVKPNEFNISTNPTATTWKDGARYVNRYIEINPPDAPYSQSFYDYDFRIPSKVNPNVKAGFGEYERSSSLDPTGSYLAPYVTSIGLYDAEYNLVAVGKVPIKPKMAPNYPINFVVRFDT